MKFLFFLSLALLIISFSIEDLETSETTTRNEYETHIGENKILGSDTLIVVDYSIIDQTFTLSNGLKVDKHIIIEDK